MAGIELEEDFLRDAVIDVPSGRAVGVNGIDVAECKISGDQIRLAMTSPFTWTRRPVVVFRGSLPASHYRIHINGVEAGGFSGKELAAGIPVPPPLAAGAPLVR
jgi:hypothetical protein